jgi:hypothetical protein
VIKGNFFGLVAQYREISDWLYKVDSGTSGSQVIDAVVWVRLVALDDGLSLVKGASVWQTRGLWVTRLGDKGSEVTEDTVISSELVFNFCLCLISWQ